MRNFGAATAALAVIALVVALPLLAADTNNVSGRQLFENRCGLCHRGSGPGVFMLERRLGAEQSILEQRTNLAPAYIRTVVRWGVGSMPRFSRGEITDAELEAIAAYLGSAG